MLNLTVNLRLDPHLLVQSTRMITSGAACEWALSWLARTLNSVQSHSASNRPLTSSQGMAFTVLRCNSSLRRIDSVELLEREQAFGEGVGAAHGVCRFRSLRCDAGTHHATGAWTCLLSISAAC